MTTPNTAPTPGSNGRRPAALPTPMGGPGGMRPGMGGPMGMIKGEKARDFKGTMRKLVGYMGPYKIATLLGIILAVFSTVFSIFGPKLLGNATTILFKGAVEQVSGAGNGIDLPAIGRVLLITLGLYSLSAILSYLQGWIMTGVAVDITYRLRRDIAQKINRMPLKYFDGTNHGEILSRVTNDVDTVNQTLSQSLSQIITSVVSVVGATSQQWMAWPMIQEALRRPSSPGPSACPRPTPPSSSRCCAVLNPPPPKLPPSEQLQ